LKKNEHDEIEELPVNLSIFKIYHSICNVEKSILKYKSMRQDNRRRFKILIKFFIFARLRGSTHLNTIQSIVQINILYSTTWLYFYFFYKMYYLNKPKQYYDSNKNIINMLIK